MAEPRIAAIQFNPRLGAVVENRARSNALLVEAAAGGANIAILPECCVTGYVFGSVAELGPLAEPRGGATIDAWMGLSVAHGMVVVGGFVESSGGKLFDTAVVIQPDGRCDYYRKLHLWSFERALYAAGDSMLLVDTPFGRLGVAICYDLWFPELIRAMALGGATLIALPTNWTGNPRHRDPFDVYGLPMGCHLAMAAAAANEVSIAIADRSGTEGGLNFLGSSCIIGVDGRPLGGPASRNEETIVFAPWRDPAPTRGIGQSHLASRRTDVYCVAMGPSSVKHELPR